LARVYFPAREAEMEWNGRAGGRAAPAAAAGNGSSRSAAWE
jgi:hypothetical protein